MDNLDQVGCYLSKSSLDGRTTSEKMVGQTPDISIFRFAWFQPIWYYNLTRSFPQDRMSPGFFLKITENTGDSFACHVSPAKDIKDIPRHRNPVVLVRCVVRPRNLSSSNAPRCSTDVEGFKFTNTNGDEIFAEIEYNTSLAEQELVDEEISRAPVPDYSIGLPPGVEDIPETYHHPQALESLMTLDVDIPTISEEEEDDDINDCLIVDEDIPIGVDQEISPNIPTNDGYIPPLSTCTHCEPDSKR